MKSIDLIAHPEGGRFCEIFRSVRTVINRDGAEKAALTHIYFSLDSGEVSRFHRVASDEVWNLYQGAGIRLYLWDGTETPPQCMILSADHECFCHVVPAGIWQAAEPIGETVLVGCTVAPGFEFADFSLIDPDGEEAGRLLSVAPELGRFVVIQEK